MSGRIFLDTNVLIYAYSNDDLMKKAQAMLAMQAPDCWLSTQTLIEFANVYARKLKAPWLAVEAALHELGRDFAVYQTTPATIAYATRLAQRHGFAWFDALIVAAALESGCTTLYSEDLHAGQMVEGTLRVVNPFAV